MKIIFIRHGQTKGNEEKRYIGRTDESLSQKGIEEIKNRLYPDVDTVLVSPMKRCVETAKIIYPDSKYIICNDFRECDFGIFEGKNYDELKNDSDYQKWEQWQFRKVKVMSSLKHGAAMNLKVSLKRFRVRLH